MKGTGEPRAEEPLLLRVLIVEDHKDVADSLRILLELWGFEVQTVYDGAKALAAARAFRPDCMLMDIGLPGVDGYSLAQQVRRDDVLKRVSLVAVSAYSDEVRAQAAGFDHHLVKPADLTRLETLLRNLKDMKNHLHRTEKLAQQQLAVVGETRDMVKEVKKEMKEVKEELKEVKEEVREVKQDLREVKKDQGKS
jgi:DNA-binding response OmpR family regulator